MTNNCLVTKYKTAIQNESLLKLGELRIHVNNTDGVNVFPFIVKSSESFTVDVIGNGYMYKGDISNPTNITTHYEGSDTSGYRLSLGEFYVSITPKYKLNYFHVGSSYAEQKCYINLSELKFNNTLDLMRFYNEGVTGNVADIPEGSYLDCSYTLLSGNVGDLAKLVIPNQTAGLYVVSTSRSEVYISSVFTGSIEEFVSNLISENYSKTFRFRPEILNFHGSLQAATLVVTIDASGNATIANGSGTQVATYNKGTNTWTYN